MESPTNEMEEQAEDHMSFFGEFKVEEKEKNRERNREHAKKTRLRKKATIEIMKDRLLKLQKEATCLQQQWDEAKTANILLGLSVNSAQSSDDANSHHNPEDFFFTIKLPGKSKGNLVDDLKMLVRGQAAKKGYCDTSSSAIASFLAQHRTQIDWKEGTVMYSDGSEQKLSEQDVELLRKERNRMHAKMTRDRKRLFMSQMKQMIAGLEVQIHTLRGHLQEVAASSSQSQCS